MTVKVDAPGQSDALKVIEDRIMCQGPRDPNCATMVDSNVRKAKDRS